MTAKTTDNATEPPANRSLVLRDAERAEMEGHAELAIEQSDRSADITITTHPPEVEVTDSDGEVARVPLDDSLELDA